MLGLFIFALSMAALICWGAYTPASIENDNGWDGWDDFVASIEPNDPGGSELEYEHIASSR